MKVESIVAVPPDGGYGWVIVAISFYAYAVIDFPSMGFQVISPSLMDTLHLAASAASTIFSSYTLVLFFLGPFAGGICNRFGFKATTILGCLLMIGGLVAGYYINSYVLFIIFNGLIAGFGASMVCMIGNVAPGFWFEEKRAIALGLASSATGLAVFSVTITILVEQRHGWRMCFLFWAISAAVLIPLAFLLKMPPLVELETAMSVEQLSKKQHLTAQDIADDKLHAVRPIGKGKEHEKVKNVADNYGVPLRDKQKAPTRYLKGEDEQSGSVWGRCLRCCCCQTSHEIGARPLYKKDIFYHGNKDHAANIEKTHTQSYTFAVSKLPTRQDVKEETECHCRMPEAVVRALNELVDVSLLKSVVFQFIVVASLLTYTSIYIPFLLIKKVNLGKMDDSHATLLVTIMGLGSAFGRATVGFLLYFFPKIKTLQVLIFFSILGGILLCCVPLNYSFVYQATVSFLGGAVPATVVPLRSVVIIEMLGLSKLTSATGILFFIQGIGCFIGMPIAELLNEYSGTNYLGLVFSGVCLILVGIVFLGLAILSFMKGKKSEAMVVHAD